MSRIIHESQTSSPVERILLCHPGLPEKCLNGKLLSEDAGIEEIAEQIFLYAPDDPTKNDWKEAVQFLGLCVGLYTLPSSLKDDETTKAVYLGKSTLIFVPLEQNGQILAVVQIRRGSGNPLAVRQSIEKCHSLFEMFHGGGILHRLKQKNYESIGNSKCIYPGLDQLYSIRKEIRKHKTKQSRLSCDADDYGALQQQIDNLSRDLDHLQQQLPNESIRKDLASHYNEFLDNLSLVTSRQGGGLRCLVDCIPVPIAQDSGLHTMQSSPSRLSKEITISKLKTDIQHILVDEAHKPLLFGISTFYIGHLVQFDFFGNIGDGSHFLTGNITSETVTTIMGYMASYRIKLQQNSHGKKQPSPLRFGSIASSLAYNKYQDHQDQLSFGSQHESLSGGSFLVPPPSFMMSGSSNEENQSIAINEQIAWAPKLNLTIKGFDEETEPTSKVVRVLLYTVGDFSFLVFLHQDKLDLQSIAGRNMVCNVLVSVRNKMDAAAMIACQTTVPSKDSPLPSMGEPGVDFILIDRKQHELTLFADSKAVASSPSKKSQGNGTSPRKRFGFMPPKRTVHSKGETKANSQSREWSVLGLDCRHLLASHLHLDVLLAFDDMMNDIDTKFSRHNSPSSADSKKYVELCTCMALGWVYGCANEDTELYAFFDNSTYVTVSDVQNAVKRIQNKVS